MFEWNSNGVVATEQTCDRTRDGKERAATWEEGIN